MNRLFCDECEKEIEDNNYIQQSLICYWDIEGNAEATYCRKCWEKFEEVSK